MLRIGICDDIADARLLLQDALERVLEMGGWEAQFFQFSSGEGLVEWFAKHSGELDLVFLDMEMKALDGIETAKRLRAMDENLQLVFCTSYADYVYDGYGTGALDRAYICRSGDITYRIPLRNILYFVSERRKVRCVTTERTLEFYGKLDEVAREVGDAFVRVHQRYLVRIAAIAQMEASEVVLAGGERLPMSRSCRQAALLAVARSALEGRE